MSLRVLVLDESTNTEAALRFAVEAEAAGVALDVVAYDDVRFLYDGSRLDVSSCEEEADLLAYSHYICRATKGFQPLKNAILTAVIGRRAVLNGEGFQRNVGFFNKLEQMVRLAAAGLPLVPTRLTSAPDEYCALVAEALAAAPTVFLKPTSGTHGDGARVIRSLDDLGPPPSDREVARTLIQDHLPARSDYRVLVLGDRPLGAMERTKAEGSAVSSVSKGGTAARAELSPGVLDVAVRASRAVGLDFAGVDLMLEAGEPRVLEVNTAPEFSAFEEVTGVNVAGSVLSYLLER